MSKTTLASPRPRPSSRCSAGSTLPAKSITRSLWTAAGDGLLDRPLPNSEPDLMELFEELEAHGRVLVVVDQLASIGALAIAVARSRGVTVAYLPGLAMRRIADLYPGDAKTDARDAHVIADAARTLPHALRRVGTRSRPPSSSRCWPATTPTWPPSPPG